MMTLSILNTFNAILIVVIMVELIGLIVALNKLCRQFED